VFINYVDVIVKKEVTVNPLSSNLIGTKYWLTQAA
jgi:hypothetical protein